MVQLNFSAAASSLLLIIRRFQSADFLFTLERALTKHVHELFLAVL